MCVRRIIFNFIYIASYIEYVGVIYYLASMNWHVASMIWCVLLLTWFVSVISCQWIISNFYLVYS